MSKIINNLYLGNKKDPYEKDWHLIINCTTNLPFPKSCNNTIRIPIEDDPFDSNKLFNLMKDTTTLEEMHTNILNDKFVLVHCQQGIQRSPTIVACYLIKYHNYTKEQAIEFIKSKRQIAFFWQINLEKAIDLFYNYINLSKNT